MPFRTQLAIALSLFTVVLTLVFGVIAYRAAGSALENHARAVAAMQADSLRALALARVRRQHDQSRALLDGLEANCGAAGRMNTACAREALQEFVRDNQAASAELLYGREAQLQVGPKLVAEGSYVVQAASELYGSQLTAVFPAAQMASVFNQQFNPLDPYHTELIGRNGEELLPVGSGKRMYSPAVQACLAGGDSSRLGAGIDGQASFQAMRAMPELGGACAVAEVPRATVVEPAMALRRRILAVSVVFVIVALLLSGLMSQVLAKPLQSLEARVEQLKRGEFDGPLRPWGPAELRRFATNFEAMARSLQASRQEIESSEKRMRMIYRAARLWLWEFDFGNNRVSWMNAKRGEFRSFSQSVDEFLSRVFADDRERVAAAVRSAQQSGEMSVEYRVQGSGGRLAWLASRGQMVALDGRRVLMGVNLEITLLKNAEAAVLESERLEATSEMAASLAHEINNPLAAMVNALYVLRHSGNVHQEDDCFEIMNASAQRIGHIVKQITGLYRARARAERVDLRNELKAVLADIQGELSARQVEIHAQFGPVPEVLGFSAELRHVFAHVLRNALANAPRAATVRVRLRCATEWSAGERGVRLSIGDSGPGIPRALREDLFRPFVSGSGEPGTGLGLWLAKAVVAKHRGKLRLWSSIAEGASGTVCSFFFPAAPQGAQDRVA